MITARSSPKSRSQFRTTWTSWLPASAARPPAPAERFEGSEFFKSGAHAGRGPVIDELLPESAMFLAAHRSVWAVRFRAEVARNGPVWSNSARRSGLCRDRSCNGNAAWSSWATECQTVSGGEAPTSTHSPGETLLQQFHVPALRSLKRSRKKPNVPTSWC